MSEKLFAIVKIYYLDNTRFLGERIIVEESRPLKRGPPARSDYRIVVENLHPSVSWQDLKDFFRKAGDIVYVDVDRSREEGMQYNIVSLYYDRVGCAHL